MLIEKNTSFQKWKCVYLVYITYRVEHSLYYSVYSIPEIKYLVNQIIYPFRPRNIQIWMSEFLQCKVGEFDTVIIKTCIYEKSSPLVIDWLMSIQTNLTSLVTVPWCCGVFIGQYRNEALEKEVVCAVWPVPLLLQRWVPSSQLMFH